MLAQRYLGARLEVDETHCDLLVPASDDQPLRLYRNAARQLEVDLHSLSDG